MNTQGQQGCSNEINIKSELYFHTTRNTQSKMKLENNPTYDTTKKNTTLRNKFNKIQNLPLKTRKHS